MELVRQKAYKKTFDIACRELGTGSLEERLVKAGITDYHRQGEGYRLVVPLFDETIELVTPACTFRSVQGSGVSLVTRIVVLHYLLHASGRDAGSEPIGYDDIPGCRSYLPVFERRVVRPLLSAFGYDRDAFMEAGKALGGNKADYGSASFTVPALPRVPLTFVLWEGDQDFPSTMKVLFDRSISEYLPLEDITVIAKMASTRMLAKARRAYSSEYMEE